MTTVKYKISEGSVPPLSDPNPTQGFATISSNALINTVWVHNPNGKELIVINDVNRLSHNISTHKLEAGIYTITVLLSDNSKHVEKLIVL
ncbi:MAG: Uncharacterised protein [Flavobacteriaceae bacterium]|nr:MAG: Uncharacterised protein [Flavobacteriaceae bacterium]